MEQYLFLLLFSVWKGCKPSHMGWASEESARMTDMCLLSPRITVPTFPTQDRKTMTKMESVMPVMTMMTMIGFQTIGYRQLALLLLSLLSVHHHPEILFKKSCEEGQRDSAAVGHLDLGLIPASHVIPGDCQEQFLSKKARSNPWAQSTVAQKQNQKILWI